MYQTLLLLALVNQPELPQPNVAELMIVTAQAEPVSQKEALHRVEVFDAERIEAQGAVTLRDLLVHELTIDLNQHSVFGGSLEIGGLSAEHIKILVDGVPLAGRLNGIIDLDQISLAMFERVELIRGPTSVYYGTDALAGVVNLISKQPGSGGVNIQFQSLYDSVDQTSAGLSANINHNAHSWQVGAGGRQFDGISQDQERTREWNERHQEWASLGYRFLAGGFTYAYDGKLFDETLSDLGAANDGVATDTDYHTQRQIHQVSGKGFIGDLDFVDVSLSFSDYERYRTTYQTDLSTSDRQDQAIDPDLNTFDQWRVRGMWSHRAPQAKFFAGIDAYREQSDGARILDGTQEINDVAAFAGVEWQFGTELRVQPSVRVADNSRFDAPVTPALNVLYSPGTSQWRFNYTRGFRAPSIKELYLDFHMQAGPNRYDILGNQQLDPESGDHWNLSFSKDWDQSARSWKLFAQGYRNELTDLITLSQLTPVDGDPGRFERSYININHHQTQGIETQFSLQQGRFQATIGADYYLEDNQFAESFSVAEETHTLDGKFQLRVGGQGDLWQGSLFYSYRGSRPGFVTQTNRGTGETTIFATESDRVNMLDLSVHRWLMKRQLRLSAGIRNALDIESIEHVNASGQAHSQDSVGWGRSFFIEAKYHWSSRN